MKDVLLRHLPTTALLLFALAWIGCESSPVPLSDPTIAVDPALLGRWEMVTPEDEAGDVVDVFRFNEFEYYVEYREATRGDDGSLSFDDLQRVRMFVTEVDARVFVNVVGIGTEESDEWLFMELERTGPEEARLTPVPDSFYRGLGEEPMSESVLEALRGAIRGPLDEENRALFRRLDA